MFGPLQHFLGACPNNMSQNQSWKKNGCNAFFQLSLHHYLPLWISFQRKYRKHCLRQKQRNYLQKMAIKWVRHLVSACAQHEWHKQYPCSQSMKPFLGIGILQRLIFRIPGMCRVYHFLIMNLMVF